MQKTKSSSVEFGPTPTACNVFVNFNGQQLLDVALNFDCIITSAQVMLAGDPLMTSDVTLGISTVTKIDNTIRTEVLSTFVVPLSSPRLTVLTFPLSSPILAKKGQYVTCQNVTGTLMRMSWLDGPDVGIYWGTPFAAQGVTVQLGNRVTAVLVGIALLSHYQCSNEKTS